MTKKITIQEITNLIGSDISDSLWYDDPIIRALSDLPRAMNRTHRGILRKHSNNILIEVQDNPEIYCILTYDEEESIINYERAIKRGTARILFLDLEIEYRSVSLARSQSETYTGITVQATNSNIEIIESVSED